MEGREEKRGRYKVTKRRRGKEGVEWEREPSPLVREGGCTWIFVHPIIPSYATADGAGLPT